MTDPILFLLAVVTLLGTPGPTNTLLATSGAAVGVWRSLPLLAGELAGYLIAVSAIRFVLSPVIATWPVLGIVLKVAVVIYLIWMAVHLWQSGHGGLAEPGTEIRAINVFVTTLLNPKALIVALSILPQVNPWAYFLAFLSIIPVAGLSWIVIGRAIGLAAGERHSGTVRKAASVALLGFAGVIAASVVG